MDNIKNGIKPKILIKINEDGTVEVSGAAMTPELEAKLKHHASVIAAEKDNVPESFWERWKK